MRAYSSLLLWLVLGPNSWGQGGSGASANVTNAEEVANSAARLPVTRVVLYKNGVGYFEHTGKVHGSQDVDIVFTTAQLNDVLKSLTVLDFGKGRITNVGYNSNAPLQRRLGALRLPVGENPTAVQFLDALRGARLEVRNGSATATGRLLSIDQRELTEKNDQKVTVDEVSIITDGGEVRMFDLTPLTSVRIMEQDVKQEVGKYLGLVSSTRDQDLRHVTISTAGEGERNLSVSYISEVPVWKCTYRIVMPQEGKPLLQGWAIVDNTVGEDWKNVELSLVAGAPQSFVQELSQPYYTRRQVVPLPENVMATPQTHEATLVSTESVEVQAATDGTAGGMMGRVISGVAGGVVGGGSGAGVAAGTGGGAFRSGFGAAGKLPSEDAGELLEAATTVAQTQDLGDLFEYKLKDKLTIRKNQSALVPILQTRIDAEKVSMWNMSAGTVLRALWVNNTSDLTLDGGSFSVLEGDAFAGEGLTDPIKPGEKRLLSYAADLGLVVDAKRRPEAEVVSKVIVAHGDLMQVMEVREELTYTIRNRDTAPRVVVIEHPVRAGWKLKSGTEPAESSVSFYRFRVNADAKKTTSLTVEERSPITRRYELRAVTDDQIDLFVRQKTVDTEVEKALRGIGAQKNNIAALDGEAASRKAQIANISQDQQRLRENMKALKGSAEEKVLVERYVRELNAQEDAVQKLQAEVADFSRRRDDAQKTLNQTIEGLQLEVKL